MATIDDKSIIDKIIASNGDYADGEDHDDDDEDELPPDPPVIKIVEYNTPEGGTTWGVVWEGDGAHPDRYNWPSAFVLNPRTIFERKARAEKSDEEKGHR